MASRFGHKRLFDDSWRKRRNEISKSNNPNSAAEHLEAVSSAVETRADIIKMIEQQSLSMLTTDNKIDVYTNARDKYDVLYNDILNAKTSVHLLYFTFNADHVGRRFVNLLAEKAAQGVEVRLLFDSLGNFPYTIRHFRKINQAGGQVFRFFPLVNILKVNYRNHRKIAVIDGRIAYTGGINVSKSYIGGHPRAKPWRDTHIRITGSGVNAYQERFFLDWIHVSKEKIDFEKYTVQQTYFPIPAPEDRGQIAMQTVSSGPDVEGEHIKFGFIKMIHSAKRSLYIQSPYLVPDDAFVLALKIAVDSGVDVRIVLPGIPDKRLVYVITRSYMKDLLRAGIKIYLYNGFVHSKMLVIDGDVTTIGTTNIDMRSFLLDFEINAFIYDAEFTARCEKIFHDDIENSREITLEQAKDGILLRLVETVLKILSPLL
jgi:cardiolipin synthase